MQAAFGVRMFTPGDVSLRTGMPVKTVLAAIRRGELGALRANRQVIRISEGDLARWLDLLRARAQRVQLK